MLWSCCSANPLPLITPQALREGRLRPQALQPDERMRRPGLGMLVLDEADLMLSMPGYEEDLRAIAPLVRTLHLYILPGLAYAKHEV